MIQVYGVPPNFKAINDKFSVRGKPVLFCYGDKIYNPMKIVIPPELIAHEEVHSKSQLQMGVKLWWDLYIKDKLFRLEEEIEAHRAEYQYLLSTQPNGLDRKAYESSFAKPIIERLSGPLYGNMITYEKALERITA